LPCWKSLWALARRSCDLLRMSILRRWRHCFGRTCSCMTSWLPPPQPNRKISALRASLEPSRPQSPPRAKRAHEWRVMLARKGRPSLSQGRACNLCMHETGICSTRSSGRPRAFAHRWLQRAAGVSI
jgi:hypothetical protein